MHVWMDGWMSDKDYIPENVYSDEQKSRPLKVTHILMLWCTFILNSATCCNNLLNHLVSVMYMYLYAF